MERLTLEEAIKYIKEVVCKNRKNKEKNTIVIPNSFISSADCAEKYEQVAKWLKELKSYKDLEEQGLLVRLPVKIGDTMYCIDNGIVELLIVNSFRIYNFNRIEIDFENASGFTLCTFSGELDEGYFLTREEAERKLEELKNEI